MDIRSFQVGIMCKKQDFDQNPDITEYYLYSYHYDFGKNSSDPEMMMVEYLDVIQMFEESTMNQVRECESQGKCVREFFPLDGAEDETNSFYNAIFNCTDIL